MTWIEAFKELYRNCKKDLKFLMSDIKCLILKQYSLIEDFTRYVFIEFLGFSNF
ncbi:hypothetical protein Theam_0672 [Thermovibrio ammonificans HB-1]|uniref:Uncharacterized protein n=1 Tax=Thermovibrio ammonificans (strain DSM 15698 / JCM 12110 / HB-1) TaxID=648996 RepID=E8T657_THEA1|nr:hypothetical protein Theam_0672 [Thermovibrio ammonificans HB-1]